MERPLWDDARRRRTTWWWLEETSEEGVGLWRGVRLKVRLGPDHEHARLSLHWGILPTWFKEQRATSILSFKFRFCQKQIPKEVFRCKLFIWELVQGSVGRLWGMEAGKGRRPGQGVVMSRLQPGAAGPPSHGQACAGVAGTDSQSQPGASFPSSEITDICEELEFHLGGRIYTTAIGRCYRLRPYLPLFPSQGLLTARGCLLRPLEDFFPGGRALGSWGIYLRAAPGGLPAFQPALERDKHTSR